VGRHGGVVPRWVYRHHLRLDKKKADVGSKFERVETAQKSVVLVPWLGLWGGLWFCGILVVYMPHAGAIF